MPHKNMINLIVPDTFEGACASILLHGYARTYDYGISVRYYQGDCATELNELLDWIKVADAMNAPIAQDRRIYVCSKNGFPKKQIRELKKDPRNTVIKFGAGYLRKLYGYLCMTSGLSLLYGVHFIHWLRMPKVYYFFESVLDSSSIYRLKWAALGSAEFEQFMSDYLHETECCCNDQE